jgi:hypothetical protein
VRHSQSDYDEAVASPDWGNRVVNALRSYFATGQWLMEPVDLISADLEVGPDGGPVLVAIYDLHGYRDRLGYRRPLDRPPNPIEYRDSPAASLAASIAQYEISEPIAPSDGSSERERDGVRWWMYDDPAMAGSIDAPWYAGLPWARWRSHPGPWTVAANHESVCGSLAVAGGSVLERPTVLMPPQPVHCVRPEGHLGVHGSASRSEQPDRSSLEVFGWDEPLTGS